MNKEILHQNNEGYSFWQKLLVSEVTNFTDDVVEKYSIDKRLNYMQLEIFKNYFASYRTLTDKDNVEIFDYEKIL